MQIRANVSFRGYVGIDPVRAPRALDIINKTFPLGKAPPPEITDKGVWFNIPQSFLDTVRTALEKAGITPTIKKTRPKDIQ